MPLPGGHNGGPLRTSPCQMANCKAAAAATHVEQDDLLNLAELLALRAQVVAVFVQNQRVLLKKRPCNILLVVSFVFVCDEAVRVSAQLCVHGFTLAPSFPRIGIHARGMRVCARVPQSRWDETCS